MSINDLSQPLVSVITPVFNSEKFIEATIKSVINQTYQNWEMLITYDSGTVDNTLSILKNYVKKDSRIKFFYTETRGVSSARNKSISESKGDYLAFLDSDDLWLSDKLEQQILFMKKNNHSFTCTSYRRISEDEKKVGKLIEPPAIQNYNSILCNNFIPCLTVVIKKEVLNSSIKFVDHPQEDYIFWLQLIKKHNCFSLNQDLSRYRIVTNSRSTQVNRIKIRWLVYRNFEKLSLFKAVFFTLIFTITAILKRLRF